MDAATIQKLAANPPPEGSPLRPYNSRSEASMRAYVTAGRQQLGLPPKEFISRGHLLIEANTIRWKLAAAERAGKTPSARIEDEATPVPAMASAPVSTPSVPNASEVAQKQDFSGLVGLDRALAAHKAKSVVPAGKNAPEKKQDLSKLTGLDRVTAAFAEQARASSFAERQASAAAVPSFTSTATLVMISNKVYGHRAQPEKSLPEPQLREACARIIYQEHGAYPGCEADFSQLAAKKVFRPELHGMARTEAAFRQGRINNVLQGKQ